MIWPMSTSNTLHSTTGKTRLIWQEVMLAFTRDGTPKTWSLYVLYVLSKPREASPQDLGDNKLIENFFWSLPMANVDQHASSSQR